MTMLADALQALMKIREIADGRRHYRDDAGGEGCFDALGAIRDVCDAALGSKPAPASSTPTIYCGLCSSPGYDHDTNACIRALGERIEAIEKKL